MNTRRREEEEQEEEEEEKETTTDRWCSMFAIRRYLFIACFCNFMMLVCCISSYNLRTFLESL